MSPGHPLPNTFEDAMKMTESILQSSSYMMERGSVESEVEQLVIGAYRKATGRARTFSRNDLYVRVLDTYPREAGELLVSMAHKRASGEPLQYLVGYQYFLNHEFEVNPSVLIPRPETEILVYETAQHFKRQIHQPKFGIEIGLGSGCISIELLKLFPELRICASEILPEAIEVATRNAEKILGEDRERLKIFRAQDPAQVLDVFQGKLKNKVSFIVSNPPYLASKFEADNDVMNHEPRVALFAPESDPLYFYREVAEHADEFLEPLGMVFLECPHERIESIEKLFGGNWKTQRYRDLTGRERVLTAQLTVSQTLN